MIFKHDLVTPVKIERTVIDGKRHYITPDGTFKSVTTILGEKLPEAPYLKEWKERVGEQEAAEKLAVAGRRGAEVHQMLEKYILNEECKSNNPFTIESFSKIKKVLDEYVELVYGVEVPLYSKLLKTAGTADLVCMFDDVLSIVDFKTSKDVKREENIEGYFLQATAYSMMFESLYYCWVPRIVIIITPDYDQEAQVFIKERRNYIRKVFDIFK